ncbi:phosphocholine cytidylyltransferase family protein [bacterium]|nr:phosphocholine cytidylyltransferase family protein [bacterium]
MKALILLAGKARRMGKMTENLPKTLLKVNGKPILQWMIDSLLHEGVEDFIFVVGFLQDKLRNYISENYPDLKVTWITNELYGSTNTSYSVLLTRDVVLSSGEPILLINGDVVLDRRVIHEVLHAPHATSLAVRLDRVAEEEVKFRLNERKEIIEIGKHINPAKADGESVGINRLSVDLLQKLYPILERRIKDEEHGAMEFYEASFNESIHKGEVYGIADVTRFPVMEIDTVADYEEAKEAVRGKLEE